MRRVESGPVQLAVMGLAGLVAGLAMLVRGMAGFREAARIGDISTSRVFSLAIGEVRVSGVVEPAGITLVSPLQSAPCVFYRSSVREGSDGDDRSAWEEERSLGFRVRDATGSVRVFPRGARWDVPDRFRASTGAFGETPPGLLLRTGNATSVAQATREEQIATLLTVRRGAPLGLPSSDGARQYREARVEPGDTVTVVGQVLPFDQLPDPAFADAGETLASGPGGIDDPEVAASIAAARAAGTLAATPEEAWGNAAIPGFGIGRPVTQPRIDPAAASPRLATEEEARRAEETFDIAPGDLVIAAAPDAPLVVALGEPGVAAARHTTRFLVGLVGALVSIASAVLLALAVDGLFA